MSKNLCKKLRSLERTLRSLEALRPDAIGDNAEVIKRVDEFATASERADVDDIISQKRMLFETGTGARSKYCRLCNEAMKTLTNIMDYLITQETGNSFMCGDATLLDDLAPVYKLSSPLDPPALRPRATNVFNPWFSRHFRSASSDTPRPRAVCICMTYLSKRPSAPKTACIPHQTLFFSAICFLTRLLANLEGQSYDLS